MYSSPNPFPLFLFYCIEMTEGLLAVICHPDDETFGCGGTLALHAEKGDTVDVLCLTLSEEERRGELECACDALGVIRPIIFEDKILVYGSKLIRRISDIIVEKRPRIIFTHLPFDYHREHRLAYELVKEAIEWAAHTTTYSEPWLVERLLLVEVSSLIPQPYVLVDISAVMDRKVNAVNCYTSQLAKFSWGYYEKFTENKARLRGVQAGCEYAEAFQEEALKSYGPFYPVKSSKDGLL